jgi:DNA-binding SARP family transcriptional activator
MTSPPILRIRCVGPPTVLVGGASPPPDVLWRKHLALLVYLALSPGRARSRDHLLGLLWPEKDQQRARHSLNEAVRRLRLGLGSARIITSSDTVALDPAGLVLDTGEGDGAEVGQLLEGFSLPDAPAFEQWLDGARARQASRVVEQLLASGERALGRSDLASADDHALRALQVEPASERAARLRIRARALAGDAAGALRIYQEFAGWLEREIGEGPSAELAALADRIRMGHGGMGATAGPGPDPPLVGRARAHTAAFREVTDGRTAGPRVLVLAGLVGSGKSRLLRECASRWILDGGVCAVARPLEADRGVPWRVLHLLLRGGLGAAPGLRAAPPRALGAVATVAPSLADYLPRVSPVPGDVASAFADIVRAVAEERPLCLAIDDAQWADDASVGALLGAAAGLTQLPVLLMASELEGVPDLPPTLRQLHAEVGRHVAGTAVRLDPLDSDDIAMLVDALAPWCDSGEPRDRLVRRVAYESGGNPLFAVTLLQGLAEVAALRDDALHWPPRSVTMEAPFPMEVPNLVRSVMVARIGSLDVEARRVLQVAAVGGEELDEAAIRIIGNLDGAALERALVELERQGFIQFDGERYRVRIPFLAQVVRTAFLTPSQAYHMRERYEAARRPDA